MNCDVVNLVMDLVFFTVDRKFCTRFGKVGIFCSLYLLS